jgi:3-methylfumaryl-CoA hydratase
MGAWDAWIGREERRQDRVDAGLVGRWCATLDRDPCADGAVPQGLHWCLCPPDAPTAQLGPDGHPLRDEGPDSFLPPVPLPRRMWASSKIEFLRPLRVGEAVERISRVQSITEKQGGSGALVFVDLAHETSGDGLLAVREVQSLVYRGAALAGGPPAPPPPSEALFDPAAWDARRVLAPAEPLLFRYSALTFNSHRIHYDLPYATREEGYRGLVVHGPLTATLMLQLAAIDLGDNRLKTFEFRGVSPAICGESLHLVLRSNAGSVDLSTYASDGREVMRGGGSI